MGSRVWRVLAVCVWLLCLSACSNDDAPASLAADVGLVPSPLFATASPTARIVFTPTLDPVPTFTPVPGSIALPATATAQPPTTTALPMPAPALPTSTAIPVPPPATPVPPITIPPATSASATTFTIAAVGDLLLHYNIINTAESRGYDFLFDAVRPYLRAADLTYANHEGASDPATALTGDFPTFNYSPKLDVAAKNAGIDIVSTANNHALDRGSSGLDHTIASLDAAGVLHHGTTVRNVTPVPYQPITLTAKNGVVLHGAFISATYGTNGVRDSYGQVNLLWDQSGHVRQGLKDDIAKAHKETDVVVVAVHWGTEYQITPTTQQVQGAQELADAGADIILGDHPHTLEPVDSIHTADGRNVFVIYSLGNFIAAQERYEAESYTQASVILYVTVVKDGNSRARFDSYSYLPVYIENDTRPVPITGNAYAVARQHILEQMHDPTGQFILPT